MCDRVSRDVAFVARLKSDQAYQVVGVSLPVEIYIVYYGSINLQVFIGC